MPADTAYGSEERGLGVAPSSMMDEVLLPRKSLSVGAMGRGDEGRRYRLLAPIDRGGMGELFLAEMTAPGQDSAYVVLKRLLADLLDDDKYVSMFHSEAAVMSKLNHGNIVRVFDMPVIDGAPCLAMEYVRGRNVQQILTRHDELGTKIPPAIVLRIMADVLDGLAYAHDFHLEDGTPLNLVHRDVTPGNVLVSFDGDVKLTDFGIAKSQMSAVSTTVGIVKGKARYLSPEQILGEAATPSSDVFSAASVICEMLTGTPTFDRASVPKTLYAIVNGNRPNLEEALDFRAPLLVQTLDRALASKPPDRIKTAAEFRDQLEAAMRLLPNGRADREAVGAYISQLFADAEDPLARYEAAPAGIASPGGVPEKTEAEVATVHGYQPAPPPPIDDLEKSSQRFVGTELIRERPRQESDVFRQARTSGIGQVQPPPPPPPSSDDEYATDDPSVPSAEALALAAASAQAGPTQIVRGQPVDAPGATQQTSAEDPNESVDEALSVLAWLQARQSADALAADRGTPAPSISGPSITSSTSAPQLDLKALSVPDEPLPNLKNTGGKTLMVFLGGLALGVVLTLGVQSIIATPEAPATEAIARVESTEAKTEDPPPPPVEAAPVELAPPDETTEPDAPDEAPVEEAAEAPAAPATLDVLYPRGARVRVNGRLLKRRVPVHGLTLDDKKNTVRIFKRGYRKVISFTPEPGAAYEMSRKLKKR